MFRLFNFAAMAKQVAVFAFLHLASVFTGGNADEEEIGMSEDVLGSLHEHMDSNKDGQLTYTELLQYVDKVNPLIEQKQVRDFMVDIDTSNDGKISFAELSDNIRDDHSKHTNDGEWSDEALREALEKGRAKFIAADADQDDGLDEHELRNLYFADMTDGVPSVALQDAFAQKDDDKNGKLTLNEFWEALGENEEFSNQERSDFKALDADMDGLLSIDEFQAWENGQFHAREGMEELFELADTNLDMHLTKDEMTTAREAIGETGAQFWLNQFAEHHDML